MSNNTWEQKHCAVYLVDGPVDQLGYESKIEKCGTTGCDVVAELCIDGITKVRNGRCRVLEDPEEIVIPIVAQDTHIYNSMASRGWL